MECLLELEGLKMWLKKPESTVQSDTKSEIARWETFRAEQYKSKTTGLRERYCSPNIIVEVNKMEGPVVIWKHLKSVFEKPTHSYKRLSYRIFKS